MDLRYHPVTAFALVYTTCLLVLVVALGGLAVASPAAYAKLSSTGLLMYLPFLMTGFAAHQSVKGNGPPFIHLLHDDLDALHPRFEKWHLGWTLVFGALATAITVVMSIILWLLGLVGQPMASPFMLVVGLGINGLVSYHSIRHSLTPPEAYSPDGDAVEAGPTAVVAWAVRRMQKNMNPPR